jgi:hypothetical protein
MGNLEDKQWLILSTLYVELSSRLLANVQCSRTEITIQFLGKHSKYRIKFDGKRGLDLKFYFSSSGSSTSSNKTRLIHITETDLVNIQDLCYRLFQSWTQFNQDCLMF